MYTSESLLDIHRRCQDSLSRLLAHCRGLSDEQVNRSLPGFGYETIRLQLYHVIAAERYWLGVLHGRLDLDEDEDRYPTIPLLEDFRKSVASAAESFLQGSSIEELNTPRKVVTWQKEERKLAPAQVLLRTQMHVYHHQGQILAMCRLVGRPSGGMDYPIEQEPPGAG